MCWIIFLTIWGVKFFKKLQKPWFQSRISPQPFFFRGGPTNNHPPDASHEFDPILDCSESPVFSEILAKKCLNEEHLSYPKFAIGFCGFNGFDLVIDPNKSTKSNQQNQRFNFWFGTLELCEKSCMKWGAIWDPILQSPLRMSRSEPLWLWFRFPTTLIPYKNISPQIFWNGLKWIFVHHPSLNHLNPWKVGSLKKTTLKEPNEKHLRHVLENDEVFDQYPSDDTVTSIQQKTAQEVELEASTRWVTLW